MCVHELTLDALTPIHQPAVSKTDDDCLLIGLTNGEIVKWEMRSDSAPKRFSIGSNAGSVNSISINSHGSHFAAGYDNGEIAIWSLAGEEAKLCRRFFLISEASATVAEQPASRSDSPTMPDIVVDKERSKKREIGYLPIAKVKWTEPFAGEKYGVLLALGGITRPTSIAGVWRIRSTRGDTPLWEVADSQLVIEKVSSLTDVVLDFAACPVNFPKRKATEGMLAIYTSSRNGATHLTLTPKPSISLSELIGVAAVRYVACPPDDSPLQAVFLEFLEDCLKTTTDHAVNFMEGNFSGTPRPEDLMSFQVCCSLFLLF